jgi:ketol-acid reductoisomerase
MLLVPDEHQPELLDTLTPVIEPGDAIGFAHGFNVTHDRVRIPAGAGAFLVAPCAPGARLREAFAAGDGVFAYVATREGDDEYLPLGLAYARAIGSARAGVLVTSFREETEVDLFGEQAVLCGGMHALLTAACDTLIEAGYSPEMAYLECVHQLVWLAATVQREGIGGTRRLISTTALYGDLTRGPRVVGEASRRAMQEMLEEIRSGAFADEFIAGTRDPAALKSELERSGEHPIEEAGRTLRARLVRGREAGSHPPTRSGVDTPSST